MQLSWCYAKDVPLHPGDRELTAEALEAKLTEVKRRQAKLQNQGAVDAPRVKYALSLYGNISNIVWDYTSDNVKGIITSPYGGPVTNFNIDPSSCTSFEITNRLWGLSNC